MVSTFPPAREAYLRQRLEGAPSEGSWYECEAGMRMPGLLRCDDAKTTSGIVDRLVRTVCVDANPPKQLPHGTGPGSSALQYSTVANAATISQGGEPTSFCSYLSFRLIASDIAPFLHPCAHSTGLPPPLHGPRKTPLHPAPSRQCAGYLRRT